MPHIASQGESLVAQVDHAGEPLGVRCAFEMTCTELLAAHGLSDQPPVNDADVSRCVDALLDALIEVEVVDELMRSEGTCALDADDLRHLRPTSGRS